MRKLYSADVQCSAGCKYCFSKWEDLYVTCPKFGTEFFDEKRAIIYPCCDGEFFEQKHYIDIAKKRSESLNKMYISISTKCGMNDNMLQKIMDLDQFLRCSNKGFVKYSIAITTRSMLDEIEPGTLSYENRIELLKKISEAGITTSVTLKPILPFIPTTEYYEIINDCSTLVKRLLIGGLYVNKNTEFYKQYISGKYETISRMVSWLPDIMEWSYIRQHEKIDRIRAYGQEMNLSVFDSDVKLIESICNE